MFTFFTNRGKLFLTFFGLFFTTIIFIEFKSIYLYKLSPVKFYPFSLQSYEVVSDSFFIKILNYKYINSNFVDFYTDNFFNYITLIVNKEFDTLFSTHLERNFNFTNFKVNI